MILQPSPASSTGTAQAGAAGTTQVSGIVPAQHQYNRYNMSVLNAVVLYVGLKVRPEKPPPNNLCLSFFLAAGNRRDTEEAAAGERVVDRAHGLHGYLPEPGCVARHRGCARFFKLCFSRHTLTHVQAATCSSMRSPTSCATRMRTRTSSRRHCSTSSSRPTRRSYRSKSRGSIGK